MLLISTSSKVVTPLLQHAAVANGHGALRFRNSGVATSVIFWGRPAAGRRLHRRVGHHPSPPRSTINDVFHWRTYQRASFARSATVPSWPLFTVAATLPPATNEFADFQLYTAAFSD